MLCFNQSDDQTLTTTNYPVFINSLELHELRSSNCLRKKASQLGQWNLTHLTALESCQRLTKDFYKANTALPTKTPTDFDKYVTAAYYFTRMITVTNLLTPTITNKTEWRLWTIRDKRPLLPSKRHTADENTDWLYLICDCRLLFHKNDYSDEFIDTNYYKQNKQNDDFELYVTKDRFYKAYGTLLTKTPTDFDKYATVA